ncbi:helix-turn-helix transcriptional regulator [Pseudofrankia asymbiotica]|uniref:helix-turn-helix transcriptional regulator n=1 Tax=Pseudofrankia asymbiotica TaxID=1834516 RepID=UPI001F5287A5|nr:response regulator transcription factor [Pseudofrankia asymbiotica]
MRGGRIVLALAGAGTATTVTVVALGVWLRLAAWDAPGADEVMAWWLASAVAALGYGLLGGWLAARRPRLPVGWLLLTFGLAHALALAGPGWLVYELAVTPASTSTPARAAMWVGNATWMVAVIGTVSVLPLLLPGGSLPSRRWRPVLAAGLAALWSLWRRGRGRPASADHPSDADRPASTASTSASGAAAERQRRQVRWVLLGLAASVVLFVAGFWLGPVLTALAMLPLPVACLVAVLRYQMWDVDLVVSRALAYGTLTAAIGACYAACVGVGGILLGRTTGAPLVATALVAVFTEPLARRLRAQANRLVFGGEHDPHTVLSLVGARLRAAEDADAVSRGVLPELAAAVARALRLPYIARALRAVAAGEVVFSAAIASRVLAWFANGGRAPLAPFPELTDREREILDLVARGLTNPAIARRLHLSDKTIRNHVSNVFTKLQVADRAEAVARARDAGLGTGPLWSGRGTGRACPVSGAERPPGVVPGPGIGTVVGLGPG